MEAFATVSDLEKRWRALDEDEKGCAEALLADASAFLRSEFARCGKKVEDGDELLAANLRRVTCSIASRCFPSDADGITQMTVTTGPFSRNRTFANPSRDMYLTKQERMTLGLPQRRQRIGFIMPAGYGE